MKTSTLYELISYKYVFDVMNQAEKSDEQDLVKIYESSKRELEDILDEDAKKLLHHCLISLENKLDYAYYLANISILNIGIKIGMDLQCAFSEDEG